MARNVLFMGSLFLPRIGRDYQRCGRNFATVFRNDDSTTLSSKNSKEIINWMRNHAPVFEVQSDAISVLSEPSEFYGCLKVNINSLQYLAVIFLSILFRKPIFNLSIFNLINRKISSLPLKES